MAAIGLLYPMYAPITAETSGQALTYGTGKILQYGIAANITLNHTNDKLYGDDAVREVADEITDYTIQFEATNIEDEDKAAMLGEHAVTGTGSTVTEYEITDAGAPAIGFGYIRKLMINGVLKYDAFLCKKVKFALDNINAETKRQNTTFGTPTMTGQGMGVNEDSSGAVKYIAHMRFTTLSAALTYIKGKLNVT